MQHKKNVCCNTTATLGENLLQQLQKQNKTSEELLCNIREMLVATTTKKYHCNISHHLLQH
jgi:hypothetical protein